MKRKFKFKIKVETEEKYRTRDVRHQLRVLFRSLDGTLDEDLYGAKIRIESEN